MQLLGQSPGHFIDCCFALKHAIQRLERQGHCSSPSNYPKHSQQSSTKSCCHPRTNNQLLFWRQQSNKPALSIHGVPIYYVLTWDDIMSNCYHLQSPNKTFGNRKKNLPNLKPSKSLPKQPNPTHLNTWTHKNNPP